MFSTGCPSPGQTECGSVRSSEEAKNSEAMDVLEYKGNDASLTATAARKRRRIPTYMQWCTSLSTALVLHQNQITFVVERFSSPPALKRNAGTRFTQTAGMTISDVIPIASRVLRQQKEHPATPHNSFTSWWVCGVVSNVGANLALPVHIQPSRIVGH